MQLTEPQMIPLPDKKYNIIYADPAWKYSFSGTRKFKNDDYKTLSYKQISKISVNEIADENCILFCWIIFNQLAESLKVIESWGFDYKTCAFAWVKTNKCFSTKQTSFVPYDTFNSFWGMGGWTRNNLEICLLATKGKPKRKSASIHQIIYEPIGKHSKKPDCVRDKIVELCGDLPRIELFARQKVQGWDCWGNEV